MRYRVHLYNHELPIDMQAPPVEVESDALPRPALEDDFVEFRRDGVLVALFRREHVTAVYEVSATGRASAERPRWSAAT